MKLVIISNMAHYRRADGVIVGHGATARELDALAGLFAEVRHVACLHDEPPPASARPYDARNLVLVPVPPAGGDTLGAKLEILRLMPMYARAIARELRDADAVHVRCPANISLLALAWLSATRTPSRRWVKYAGNWKPEGAEPTWYQLQRRWLASRATRAEVTVNGSWNDQPTHVHSFLNPCLTDAECQRGSAAAGRKRLAGPIRLVFVGHLGAAKNPRVAIDTLAELRQHGVDARLDLAGEGVELAALRALAGDRGLGAAVTFHGALAREDLDRLYEAAHFVVLPSQTEGWPKVLAEGMATGGVPIATDVGSIAEMLSRFGSGRALAMPPDAKIFARAVLDYLDEPDRWRRESSLAVTAARAFTYSAYLGGVADLLSL